jgi:hypothetical protein
MAVLVLLNIVLPTKSKPSPIGMLLCTPSYWIIQVAFLVFCGLMAAIAVYVVRREQNLKIKYGNIGMTESDIIFTSKNVLILVSLGFSGGLTAGAIGLGGGVIYNPILLTMGLPPQVSGACSLFLVGYSKLASTVVYLCNHVLNIPYSIWVGLWAIVGGFMGSVGLLIYIKLGGRQSFVIMALVFEFLISVVIIPTYSGFQAKAAAHTGTSIWTAPSVC